MSGSSPDPYRQPSAPAHPTYKLISLELLEVEDAINSWAKEGFRPVPGCFTRAASGWVTLLMERLP